MSNWKVMKLSEVATIVGGGTPSSSKSEYFENGNIPWITPKDLSGYNKRYISKGERNITELGLKNSSAKLLPKNTVLLTSRAPIGYVAIASNEISTNQGFKSLVLNDGHIPEFFYYLLKNNVHILESRATGSTFKEISGQILKDTELSIPTPDIQQKIVDILSPLDDKIELNTQINQTLEQIAQALFKSWFVDFDPVRAKVQALSDGLSLEQAELAAMQAISGKTAEELTALSQTQPDRYAELAETAKAFPCEMVEVDGVKVPKGWEVKELGSLMTIKRGGSPRPIKDFISDKGLNWVKISDATAEDNPFLFSTKEYIKSEGLSKTVLLKKGSLILSNSATPGLPRFLELDACIHDGWLYFSDIKSLTQEYLYFFFLNIRNDLVAQGNGSVFTNLKTDIVKAQKAIVPDERAIYYFDKQVKSIMNLIKYNTANLISLKETRDLLLPRLLNGELNG